MIVNSRYRFVFVHVPKAAGTSVREGLGRLPGNRPRWTARTKHETLADFDRLVSARLGVFGRLLHRAPATYFRFCFVRNPWDRMVSLHRYLLAHHAARLGLVNSSLADLLERLEQGDPAICALHSMRPQADFITTPSGRLLIDFVGHYEYLSEDFAAVLARLRCPPVTLAHANRSRHSGHDYRSEFDERSHDIVARRFADDIRHFGYVFDQPRPLGRISGPLDRHRSASIAGPTNERSGRLWPGRLMISSSPSPADVWSTTIPRGRRQELSGTRSSKCT